MSPRPSYLRPTPRILDPGFLRRPGRDVDPGMNGGPRLGPQFDSDPGFSGPQIFEPDPIEARTPGALEGPGGPGRPRLRLPDPSQIRPVEQGPSSMGAGPEPTSLKDRISSVLEGVGRSGVLDPNSEDSGAESFLGSALKGFSAVQGFRRQMSANQQAQQDKALEHKSQQDLRSAQAEYYRSRTHAGPTGMTQANRLELEDVRHGHLLERIRTAADLRRRQTRTNEEGKVTGAERVVLGRTERADVAGSRAVEGERAQATRGYRDPLAPGEENDIMARIRRQTDPNYVSDSTAVANTINPKLGVPRPAAAAPAHTDPLADPRTRSILEQYLRSHGPNTVRPRLPPVAPGQAVPSSSEGQSVAPPEDTTSAPDDQGDEEELPPDETPGDDELEADGEGDTVTDDEITSALSMVEDLGDQEATSELVAAGYTDPQVTRILARRKQSP